MTTRKEIPLLAAIRDFLMLRPNAAAATGTNTTAFNAGHSRPAGTGTAATVPTPEQQQRVDLVRSMTPYQRCEYLANFLRTQVRTVCVL